MGDGMGEKVRTTLEGTTGLPERRESRALTETQFQRLLALLPPEDRSLLLTPSRTSVEEILCVVYASLHRRQLEAERANRLAEAPPLSMCGGPTTAAKCLWRVTEASRATIRVLVGSLVRLLLRR